VGTGPLAVALATGGQTTGPLAVALATGSQTTGPLARLNRGLILR